LNRRHSDYEPLALPTELLRRCRPGHPSEREERTDESPDRESNPRPSPYHGDALPTELSGRCPVHREGVQCNGQPGYTAPRAERKSDLPRADRRPPPAFRPGPTWPMARYRPGRQQDRRPAHDQTGWNEARAGTSHGRGRDRDGPDETGMDRTTHGFGRGRVWTGMERDQPGVRTREPARREPARREPSQTRRWPVAGPVQRGRRLAAGSAMRDRLGRHGDYADRVVSCSPLPVMSPLTVQSVDL
jgi:hypothetical protein